MSAIKLVVSDMDNTLLGKDNRISAANQQAIADLKAAGIHFALATGRTHLTTRAYAWQIDNNEPAITCNGGMISRLLSGDLLFQEALPDNSLTPLLNFLSQHDCRYLIYTANSVYSSPNNERFSFFQDYNHFARSCGQPEVAVKIITTQHLKSHWQEDKSFLDGPALKLFALSQNLDLLLNLRQLVEADDRLSCAQSMQGNLDVMPAGASKGTALLSLADHYGLSKSEIAVFGDQENDLPMMAEAGLAFAMANAGHEVKAGADRVAPDHDLSGFAAMVYRYIL